ncbi:MAG: hypothetical protein LBC19_00240 [Tannerella sp.]|nr:hypothetical protein [Tannerella sp.]
MWKANAKGLPVMLHKRILPALVDPVAGTLLEQEDGDSSHDGIFHAIISLRLRLSSKVES